MQKIAIISDIHGNLPALKAVLADIEENYMADSIYCLGDLVDAVPWHNEVIDIIRNLQIPTVMGNHDERIVLDSKVIPMPGHSEAETDARKDAIGHTKRTITNENREYLSMLPASIEIAYKGVKCLLVHGSPRSNRQYIFEDRDIEDLKEWFLETKADIILTGHTHFSYIRPVKLDNEDKERLFINAGSVGRSKEKIGAKAVYLWLTIADDGNVSTTLRKIDYDVQAVIDGIKASPIPDFYVDFFEKHRNDPIPE